MREMMIVSALLKKNQLEIKFHPEAPVETEKLEAMANANRRTMRLTPSYQVIVTLNVSDNYEQLFTQIDGVLQVLAACEKLENGSSRAAGPLAN
jgi:UDP-N-acetylglucosamine 2-epimerase